MAIKVIMVGFVKNGIPLRILEYAKKMWRIECACVCMPIIGLKLMEAPLGSSPSPPVVSDPNVTATQQQGLNTKAGEASQAGSMVNQNTAYGSLNYTQTGTSPDGTPIYTANTSLSPAQQQLLTQLTGTQATAG